MKKLLIFTFPIVLMTLNGCATTPINNSSQAATNFKNLHPKQYKINNVNIHLVSQVNKDGFLTKDNIQQKYIDDLNQQLILQKKNVINTNEDVALVNVEVTHKRVFMGEGLKFIGGDHVVGGYADTVFTYNVNVVYQGVIVETYSIKDAISYKGGIFGNLKKIARDLSSSGDAQDELEDVQKATTDIVDHLKN
ncbi:hypothetical protein I2F29_12410 [Acinetobacter sp. FNA3]|nr:hypothetical protein [Acinetobacter pollinis]MBF7691283.1 hypothetical protein [Acinetobacter pollinis]MBF7694190.1 hypothetical protein [Acinetobacter pollinis]MBF7698683.1 hypothetical protein [Acinetobacter pollinis]MBF7701776.1 hypothetical protein [Acinetobacter pollinis]